MTRILLIEDNDELRENTSEILQMANYSVIAAENGKEGVRLAMEQKPDLIICDIMMPVLDGYGVLHLINKNPGLASVPFIFLTAKSERSDLRKGMEMGADDYIPKPFSDIELLNAVESRLRKTSLIRKNYEYTEEGLNAFLKDAKSSLEDLADNSELQSYKKKQVVYREGSYPHELFFLKKGKVKIYKSNEFGKELITDLLTDGNFFGYTALFDDAKYAETAETLEESDICCISREDFDRLISNNKEVSQTFIRLLAKNVSEKEQQLLDLAYNSLRKRVADALLMLQEKYKKDNDKTVIQISREDLANMAGIATESLIRTLSDFKSEKMIEVNGGKITIANEKKLSSLVN